MKHQDFWQGERGILNIKPKRIGELWESYDAIALISYMIGERNVVEVGCGQGRFSRAVLPENYIGLDLNTDAIAISRKENPDYTFKVISDYVDIPEREVMLLHSAALHVPDDEINDLFARAPNTIILAETMGPRIIRDTPKHKDLAFHYARTADDYKNILASWDVEQEFTKRDTNSGKTYTYMVFNRA